MNVMSPPFYGKGYSAQNPLLLWEVTQELQDDMRDQSDDLRRLLDTAGSLQGVMESTRDMYNTVLKERDEAYRRLQDADSKLQQVEHVVRRYAEVKDPVVASDGYTYERTELTRYLSDCKKSNSKAYSQQTKEELTEVMVDNVSLRRLAELLKGVHTVEVPQLSKRVPLSNGGGSNDGRRMRSRWTDEDPSMGGMAHAEMGAGTAGPIGGAGGRAGNGMAMNASHGGRRFDHAGKFNKTGANTESKGGLHPCIRVYGFCNFEDDCTFANYPYEACLNHIKGKCRFGSTCKELHVDPRDPAYQNPRSFANHQHHHGNSNANSAGAAAAQTESSSQKSEAVKSAEPVEKTSAEDAAAAERTAKKEESNSKKEEATCAAPATTDNAKSKDE
ncbi:RNA binding protein [Leptomonas pyrrhocoris]|uniref:RNA binding protein n=1 Tax=Leptomonas pyrrhocoris TaxID=157538 RepID=A0A0N0DX72_LEPPY|nr:RNA binding protein [Leptomonas pyrrhocoris]KPA82645.1 RNA binding protein [Leptomonas pyrrhocoris]|eukprot:XP_015661084.1 RNA binding protein [Leptomonas pyrrhocoris]